MRLSTMLTALKEKLESLIEEKTWYSQSEFAQAALDQMIRLAIYLIEKVDGKSEKVKNKLKLDYEYKLIEDKTKEELRELLEKIAMYLEQKKEEELKKAEEFHVINLEQAQKDAFKSAEKSFITLQSMTNGFNSILTTFSQCRQKTGETFTQLKCVPRHLLFLYSPFKQDYHYPRPKPAIELEQSTNETRLKFKMMH